MKRPMKTLGMSEDFEVLLYQTAYKVEQKVKNQHKMKQYTINMCEKSINVAGSHVTPMGKAAFVLALKWFNDTEHIYTWN